MSQEVNLKRKVVSNKTDQFPTDKWLMNVFIDWFDPCPLNKNPEVDGLSLSWKDKTYVNPPYSNPLPWVKKAIQEHRQGKRIVLLLKHDHTTKWFKELAAAGAHFIAPLERLKHGSDNSAPFPSVLALLTDDLEQRGLL